MIRVTIVPSSVEVGIIDDEEEEDASSSRYTLPPDTTTSMYPPPPPPSSSYSPTYVKSYTSACPPNEHPPSIIAPDDDDDEPFRYNSTAYLNPAIVLSRMASFVSISNREPVDDDNSTNGPSTTLNGGNSTYRAYDDGAADDAEASMYTTSCIDRRRSDPDVDVV